MLHTLLPILHTLFLIVLFLISLILFPLLLVGGVYLIWKGSKIAKVVGCLCVSIFVLYRVSWLIPWYPVQGHQQVQVFKVGEKDFGLASSSSVLWISNSPRLAVLPDSRYTFPEGKRALVIDLESRSSVWQPQNTLNLEQEKSVEGLVQSPIRVGEPNYQVTSNFTGFRLPRLAYGFFGFPFSYDFTVEVQWQLFGWSQLVVRESERSSPVVELNQILFNRLSQDFPGFTANWLPGRRFLIVLPEFHLDRRVLAIGPFSSPQSSLLSKTEGGNTP